VLLLLFNNTKVGDQKGGRVGKAGGKQGGSGDEGGGVTVICEIDRDVA